MQSKAHLTQQQNVSVTIQKELRQYLPLLRYLQGNLFFKCHQGLGRIFDPVR